MKIKELQENAAQEFAAGMSSTLQGAVGKFIDPLKDRNLKRIEERNRWINDFVRDANSELKSAYKGMGNLETLRAARQQQLVNRTKAKNKKLTPKPTAAPAAAPTAAPATAQRAQAYKQQQAQRKQAASNAPIRTQSTPVVTKPRGSRLREIYSNLLSNNSMRKVFENKGYDINKTLALLENMLEAVDDRGWEPAEPAKPLPQHHVFQGRDAEDYEGLPNYLKKYYFTKWLTPQQIEALSPQIDPILDRMATTYPNIVKDLNLLAYKIWPSVRPEINQRTDKRFRKGDYWI